MMSQQSPVFTNTGRVRDFADATHLPPPYITLPTPPYTTDPPLP